jgi:hypothetical protein
VFLLKLSKKTYQKTSSWIKRNARPLESARWDYFFEGTSCDNVTHILSAFQNDDGGFGHGIEPDFWLPHSSPMATWAAGRILMEIGAEKNDGIVKSMVSYLADTYNTQSGMWYSLLPENNHYAHAPWWHWEEGVQEKWMFNPSVELAAFLIHWSSEQSEASQIGWLTIEKAVTHIMNKDEMDLHEISNYMQSIKIMRSHETTFDSKLPYLLSRVSEKVMLLAERCVNKDASTWLSGYQALPLDFIDGPEHPLCERFGKLVDQNLNLYIGQLSDEVVWDISWEWGKYPEEYSISKRYWQGTLAVNRYRLLNSFGCLEN